MAQLRRGILPIRIETGRYGPKPIKPDKHVCQLCVSEPETELLLIFSCRSHQI